LLVAAMLASSGARAELPQEIPGLVAWYTASSLHDLVADGERVEKWPDSSGNGHDLVDGAEGQPATFRLMQLHERPVVTVGRLNSHAVTTPFALGDHTIFLVFSASLTSRALFSSDLDGTLGLLLRRDATHRFQNGGVARGQLVSYTTQIPTESEFSVTVLARKEGELHAFVNGVDVSSHKHLPASIRVGRFFTIEHTKQSGSDGAGLTIAEMLFYDRFLAPEERLQLTRYLGEQYALPVREQAEPAAPAAVVLDPAKIALRATLASAAAFQVGPRSAPRALPWKPRDTVAAPLACSAQYPTRLLATANHTAVQLALRLDVVAPRQPPSVRVGILRNDREYVHDAAVVESFEKWGEGFRGSGRLETVLTLESGDYVEVIAYLDDEPAGTAGGGGAAVTARIEAGAAVLEARTP
jgi:hypothetical protein